MTSFAEEMKELSDELLTEFDEREGGEIIRLKVLGVSTYDETLRRNVFSADQEYPMTGVASNYSESMINGTTIQSGDVLLTVFCEVNPSQKDKVVVDGSEYSIVNVMPTAFTGMSKVINHKLQIRK